jgi:hypothetical protein
VTVGLGCGAADVLAGLAVATGLALRASAVAPAMAAAAATAATMIRDDLVIPPRAFPRMHLGSNDTGRALHGGLARPIGRCVSWRDPGRIP